MKTSWEEKAWIHMAQARLLEEPWTCNCSFCARARKEKLKHEKSRRIALMALFMIVDHEQMKDAVQAVNWRSDREVDEMMKLKLVRLRCILADREHNRQKQEAELPEKGGSISITRVSSAGGGRRVVRKSEPMCG